MSAWVLALIAALTYASRATALIAMREPTQRTRAILDRIPGPLFAALAAVSMFQDGEFADERTIGAACGALALAPTRSLLLVLAGGVAGYGLVALVF